MVKDHAGTVLHGQLIGSTLPARGRRSIS
jgi:hypothetical protein